MKTKEIKVIAVDAATFERIRRYVQKNGGKKREVTVKAVNIGLDIMEGKRD